MNRYRSARRSSLNPATGPIVAFLIIACFGLLFVTGCSRPADQATEKLEDDTFTAEDVAKFQELASDSSDTMVLTGSGQTSVAASVKGEGATPATSVAPPADPALKKQYDAMRAGSSGDGNTFRVTNEFLNVRSEPNVGGAFVARLDQGNVVTVVDYVNAGWAKVKLADGKEGYVSAQYISKLTTEAKLKDEQKKYEGQYFVDFAFVNVRKSPDSGSEKLGEIQGQAFVKPVSVEGQWAKVVVDGKEGYISTQYLSPFRPNFLVRQDSYTLPILFYHVDQPGMLQALTQHVARLKQDGMHLLTLRNLLETVQTQEVRDVRLPPKSVAIAVSGITAENAKQVSDALYAAGAPATFFVQTDKVGLTGISEKLVLTLQANGFDVQSAGHTGDDLRTLTDSQTLLELAQSRKLLEDITHKSVFAVAYPQGGANDRVLQQAADAGYLFGVGSAPDKNFTREQFLRLPSYTITSGMSADDVVTLVK
jgi:peptidoglycan/xylan/chitin deacetylase (PgdA/CDA1 family)/SH3-like domain-containing protein